ncbi:MAG: extracellular solute-binding protein [Anaerolineae bacterium]
MKSRFIIPIFCLFWTVYLVYGRPTAPLPTSEELDQSLLIWHNWPLPESQLLTEVIDRFEEINPRVHITTEYVSPQSFNEQYVDRASSGLEPDLIIGLEPYLLYELTERALLLDVSELPLQTDGLLPGTIESLRRPDGQFAIPFTAYTDVLFYNKNHVSQPIQTLDEIIETASEGTRFALPTDFYHAYWGIQTFGGGAISPEAVLKEDVPFTNWLTWLYDAQQEPNILLNHVYQDLYQSFAQGDASYLIGNSLDLPFLENELGVGNVGVAPLPGVEPGENPGAFLELQTMAISSNASPPQVELAGELINFFINPSQQRRIALSSYGKIPLHEKVTFDERLAPIVSVLVEQAGRSDFFPMEHTPKTDYLRVVGTETYIQVLEGISSPQVAVEQLFDRVSTVGEFSELDVLEVTQSHTSERTSGGESTLDISLFIDVAQKASIYFNRPIVQIQFIAIIVGLFFAWVISDLMWAILRQVAKLVRWLTEEKSARFKFLSNFEYSGYEHLIIGIKTAGRLAHAMLEAATFPILGFFMLMSVHTWLLEQGFLGGLLLKMEWFFFAYLVYSFASVLIDQILDKTTAQAANNRYLQPAFFICLGLAIFHNLADVFTVADITLTTIFSSPVTVRALFLSTIGLYLWVGLVRIAQNLLYQFILATTSHDPGGVKATLTLARYILIMIAIGYIFTQFQFDTTTMAAITGGLSVGIGFALREILGNFISGFILLFERTLHPGDVIEVDNEISIVEDFSIRATTVRNRNNEEVIIPNQTFFTSSFKTYTGTNDNVRVSLTVQTDCVINPRQVINLLKTAGVSHSNVLEDPAPDAELLDYGNNVATFRLHLWVIEPMRSQKIISDVKLAIWDSLKEHGVALPFPEIELHFPKEKIVEREDGLPVI